MSQCCGNGMLRDVCAIDDRIAVHQKTDANLIDSSAICYGMDAKLMTVSQCAEGGL